MITKIMAGPMDLIKKVIKKNRNYLTLFLLIPAFLAPNAVLGQGESAMGQNETLLLIAGILVLILALLVLFMGFYVLVVFNMLTSRKKKEAAEEAGEEVSLEEEAPLTAWWQNIKQKMTHAVPVEEEETVMLDHDYDGIKELDNHLPPWWKYLFYVTIVFSVIYFAGYHIFGWMPTQEEEYQQQIAMAEASMQQSQEAADTASSEVEIAFTDNEEDLANGQEIYEANCAACHQKDGGGQIGPNLTDQYWIHGGSFEDIYNVIKNGVPQKGMIPWENQLTPEQMVHVASYVQSLQGTSPANSKEPQGEKYVPENGNGQES